MNVSIFIKYSKKYNRLVTKLSKKKNLFLYLPNHLNHNLISRWEVVLKRKHTVEYGGFIHNYTGRNHSTLCVENSHNKWYHKPSILGHFIIFIEES